MESSIWKTHQSIQSFPPLDGDLETDVLIIGGGMCGILCAYFLSWSGLRYCLVEAEKIGNGVSGRTHADISALQGFAFQDLVEKHGFEKAKLYMEANILALERYANMCRNIDCDFQRKTMYTYTLQNRERAEREARTIRCLGENAEFTDQTELPFQVLGAVKMKNQARFHPMKFMQGISRGLTIYENTKIEKIFDQKAVYARGTIYAKKIILATHFPRFHPYHGYDLKVYLGRSYTMAYTHATKLWGMYCCGDGDGFSFHHAGDCLIIGSRARRAGRRTKGWDGIREWMKKHDPYAKEYKAWTIQDYMSLDGLPYIGRYSVFMPNVYVATGFNQWGMTGAMYGAMLLRDMMVERENPFSALFSPQRSMWHRQLFCNAAGAIYDTFRRC